MQGVYIGFFHVVEKDKGWGTSSVYLSILENTRKYSDFNSHLV